jgi:O-methyltransferase
VSDGKRNWRLSKLLVFLKFPQVSMPSRYRWGLREQTERGEQHQLSLKTTALHMLDRCGLGQPARRGKRTLKRFIRHGTRAVQARMLWGWKPRVPEEAFSECCRDAIRVLRERNLDHVFGDYLEFGVSRGTSLTCMYRVLENEHLDTVRVFGFDSFRGLPLEAKDQGWSPGAFWSTRAATERYLRSRKVDLRRVTLVEGWFKDTLTTETKRCLRMARASLIMIDCDIYSAARLALWFCEPLITDSAVIFFDDWASKSVEHNAGEKEAFQEFLKEFPDLVAEPISTYSPTARVFLVNRLGHVMHAQLPRLV